MSRNIEASKTALKMFPTDFGLRVLLEELVECQNWDGYLPEMLNVKDLIPSECCLDEKTENNETSIKHFVSNEYAIKLYYLSKDPTYIKQKDYLPRSHVMDTR